MRNKSVKVLLVGGLVWLLVGCTTPQMASSEYLLMDNTPQVVINDARTRVNIQLLPIQVADYLAGSEIVLLSKQGDVYRSQQNLWAEPLSAQLNRLTMQGFTQRLPLTTWYRGNHSQVNDLLKLGIEVDAFYGDLEGQVHVSGRWTLFSASGQIIRSKAFVVSEKLAASGYSALVQTLAQTWFQKVLDPISKDVTYVL